VRILGRYVFREVLISSVLGTFLATFVTFLHGSDKLFEQIAGSNANLRTIVTLFAWAIPPLLPLTIPFGVLVGILIGLGRLSSDGEIIAMRAAGVSSRKVIAPVLLFAIIGVAIAAVASITLTPISARETARIITQMNANRLSADIPPRVFDEDFPNRILYVGEVVPGKITVWKPVFIVDVPSRKPHLRPQGQSRRSARHRRPRSHRHLRRALQPHPALDEGFRDPRDEQGWQGQRLLRGTLASGSRRQPAQSGNPPRQRHECARPPSLPRP